MFGCKADIRIPLQTRMQPDCQLLTVAPSTSVTLQGCTILFRRAVAPRCCGDRAGPDKLMTSRSAQLRLQPSLRFRQPECVHARECKPPGNTTVWVPKFLRQSVGLQMLQHVLQFQCRTHHDLIVIGNSGVRSDGRHTPWPGASTGTRH